MAARAELKLLPNLLSVSRLVLAFGFVQGTTGMRVGLVGAAAATDFLDGWLARRVGATTRWGALIDPLADRFFVLVAIATLLFEGAVSTVGYFVFISRDLMTAVGFLVARAVTWLRPVQFKARFAGKVVTVLQLVALLVLIVRPAWGSPLVLAIAAASLWAIADYTLALWRARAR